MQVTLLPYLVTLDLPKLLRKVRGFEEASPQSPIPLSRLAQEVPGRTIKLQVGSNKMTDMCCTARMLWKAEDARNGSSVPAVK